MRKRQKFMFLALLGFVVTIAVGCGKETEQPTIPNPARSGLGIQAIENRLAYNLDKKEFSRAAEVTESRQGPRTGVGHSCDAFFPERIAQDRAEDKALEKMEEAYVRIVAGEIRDRGGRYYDHGDWGFVWLPENPGAFTDQQLVDRWGEALADKFTEMGLPTDYLGVGHDSPSSVTVLCTKDGEDCGKDVKVEVESKAGIRFYGPRTP